MPTTVLLAESRDELRTAHSAALHVIEVFVAGQALAEASPFSVSEYRQYLEENARVRLKAVVAEGALNRGFFGSTTDHVIREVRRRVLTLRGGHSASKGPGPHTDHQSETSIQADGLGAAPVIDHKAGEADVSRNPRQH